MLETGGCFSYGPTKSEQLFVEGSARNVQTIWDTGPARLHQHATRSPSSALLPTSFGEGFLTKIDYRKQTSVTLILTSPLEDQGNPQNCVFPLFFRELFFPEEAPRRFEKQQVVRQASLSKAVTEKLQGIIGGYGELSAANVNMLHALFLWWLPAIPLSP